MSLAGLLGCKTGDLPDTCESLPETCVLDESATPFSAQLGCMDDFVLLASEPLDASIPGAKSAKTVVDRRDGNAL